jgi:hypothetical protein
MRRDSRMIEELEKSVDNLNIQQSNNKLDFDLLQELQDVDLVFNKN